MRLRKHLLRHLDAGRAATFQGPARASGARATTSRCAPERRSGSWVGTLGDRARSIPGVDSELDSTGPRGVLQGPAESTPEGDYLFVAAAELGGAGGFPAQVASQKIGAVASDLARCAPQHTICARKDPYNQRLNARCSTSRGRRELISNPSSPRPRGRRDAGAAARAPRSQPGAWRRAVTLIGAASVAAMMAPLEISNNMIGLSAWIVRRSTHVWCQGDGAGARR